MSGLEDRLRALERKLVWQPSADEYRDAKNREQTRGLHVLAERLAPHGLNGDYLFTEYSFQMLPSDAPKQQAKDREIIDAWRRAQGFGPEMEAERAKEKLLAMLEARSGA